MKRDRISFRPVKNSEVSFDDFYEEMSRDWQEKARALQTRRWRALKREMHGNE